MRGGAVHHPSHFARIAPDRPALIIAENGRTLSYAMLADRSARAANLIASLGVAEGDTIAILLENHISYPEIVWAAKDSGLRYVAISWHLNAADTAYILEDCGARLLITSAQLQETAELGLSLLDYTIQVLMVDGAVAPFIDYDEALAEQDSRPLSGRRRGSSMLYTSGTTGRPKGVRTELVDVPPTEPPRRFGMLVSYFEMGEDTVFLNPAPFYHAGPLRFMMTVHRCGGTVIGFRQFDAATLLTATERYRATHGFFVPTMFVRMLALDPQQRQEVDLSAMRHAIHAAAPCPIEVKRAMIDWWGLVIDELYSGSEAIGHTMINSREWLDHPGSVGRPSNCQIKIVDEQGVAQPPGTPGLIKMSNSLRVTYYGRAANGSLHDEDGYASLGDIGYLDEDGYLHLTDRESHMIIAGGVNIYPQEAEAVLLQHPAVADIAVIGVPHPDMGEEVKAIVQAVVEPEDPAALEQELMAFCRARLSPAKCPRSVDFVDDLPRTPMGKLNKQDIRASYWREHGRLI